MGDGLGGGAEAALDDGLGDAGGEGLAELRSAATGGLRAIADEPALDEHGGEVVFPEDAKPRGHDAAIGGDGAEAVGDRLGDGGGQRGMIVNGGAMDGPFWAIVKVDADEEDIRVGVGNVSPGIEGDEDIGGAGHDGVEAGGFELGPEAKGDVEGEIFLLEMVAGDAAVHAAVAGIDDNGVEGAGGIDDARCAAGEEENAGGKQEADRFAIGHGKNGGF